MKAAGFWLNRDVGSRLPVIEYKTSGRVEAADEWAQRTIERAKHIRRYAPFYESSNEFDWGACEENRKHCEETERE
jgi:hypothetical protein